MKRFLPLIILILAPLSLLLAKPASAQTYDVYIAQPGDSLWALAESKVTDSENKTMIVNAIKNIEIMLNNLDDTNYFLEVGQSYKLLTQSQIGFLTGQMISNTPAYLIANPAPIPNWTELRQAAQSLSPTIAINSVILPSLASPETVTIYGTTPTTTPTYEIPAATPIAVPIYETPPTIPEDTTIPVTSPAVQGAHTSIIPLADSPFPY